MKKCPKCNVAFADDMNFCLNDGTSLIAVAQASEADEPETVLSKPKPETAWKNPATVIETPQAIAPEVFSSENTAPKNNLFKYIMLAGGFLVFGTILGVGLMFISSPNPPDINITKVNTNQPQNTAVNTVASVPSNSNTEIAKAENSNQNTQPTPQKTATATPKPTEKKQKGCFLDDNGKGEGEVRVRIDCDILDCENDNDTVAGTYASKTPVKKLGGTAKSENFTWTKVKVGGKVLWVASSKIRCN